MCRVHKWARLAIGACLAVWVGSLAAGFLASPGRAFRPASLTTSAIIEGVNLLRAGQGLAPYVTDSGLMEYAQEHSDYQASINTSTHLHKDGRVSLELGIQENVAGGDAGLLTVDTLINEIWADPVHGKTLTGNAAGAIGVGIATSNGTDYITLNVRPLAQAATSTPAGSTPGAATQTPGTAIPLAPLVTVTPYPDGTIVHIVGYGQTLWAIAIAYGVKIDDIRALNGLPEGSTDIYEGQKLIIRLPGAGTPTWDGTQIEQETTPLTPTPSRTHRPTSTRPVIATRTPKPTLPPSLTITSTRPSLLPFSLPNSQIIGLILLGVSGIGILLLLVFGFGKNVK